MRNIALCISALILMSLAACTRPNQVNNPEAAIQASWLCSPSDNNDNCIWTFSGGKLSLQRTIGGVVMDVVWNKGTDSKTSLDYTITSDLRSYLVVDVDGFVPTPALTTKWSIPTKGSANKMIISEISNTTLHLASVNEENGVNGEAQRGFTKQ